MRQAERASQPFQNRVSWLLELGRDRLLPLVPQTRHQPRIPPLRSVIPNRDTHRLPLPDQDDQLLAACDACVDQVPLQQHVVLRGERGSGLAGCAYNLVAECQAIVSPIPRVLEGLIPPTDMRFGALWFEAIKKVLG
jgi:hypothetical protein